MSPAPTSSLHLRAPAKVNLGLRLTGRREDGYHTLESLFVPLALEDEVSLRWAPEEAPATLLRVAEAPDASLPPALSRVTSGPDNLAARAARAFREATDLPGRIELTLSKRIPAGAGLGGGSSDAGAVLAGLAKLTRALAPEDPALASIALGLGADVPYFLDPRPALVSGIGERIEPIDGLPPLDLVLVNPGVCVATAEVYRVSDLLRDSLTASGAGSTMRAISGQVVASGVWLHALGDLLVNDLESAAIRLCPPIGRWLDQLQATGAIGVGMSGSGATVFGAFASASAAEQAAAALRESDGFSKNKDREERPWVDVTRVVF